MRRAIVAGKLRWKRAYVLSHNENEERLCASLMRVISELTMARRLTRDIALRGPMMNEPSGGADIAAAFAHYEPYGIVPDGWWDQLRRARQQCPVVHSDRCGGFWLVSRHEDVAAILRTPAVFSSVDGITIPHHPDAPVQPPLDLDPPLHTEFRRLLNPHFTAAALRPQAPVIAALARELIGRFVDDGECEFMDAFAQPLPGMVLGRLILGVEDPGALADLQARVVVIASQNTAEEATAAWLFLRQYVTVMVEEAQGRPPDGGLVSDLVHGTVNGRPVSVQEQIGTLTVLILGGLGTTADAIAMIMVELTDDPALEARLRDPAWVAHDLDEFLRVQSPVQWLGRTVTAPVELGGVPLAPGDRVMAHIGSANRDHAAFERADVLDFSRGHMRSLAYGTGPHHCIGANLARLVIEIGFAELFARITRMQRDKSVPLSMRDGTSRPLRELRITFDAR